MKKYLSRIFSLILISFLLPVYMLDVIPNETLGRIVMFALAAFILLCWNALFEIAKYIERLEDRIKYIEQDEKL